MFGRRNTHTWLSWLMVVFLILSTLVGCGKQPTPPSNENPTPDPNGQNGAVQEEVIFENGFFRPSEQFLPQEIAQWLEYSREVQVVQEKVYEDYRYVLITDGMRQSGGYAVEIQSVNETATALEIQVKHTEPLPGQIVTEALTYPYDLIIVENKELPIQFVDVDNPDRYFMGLLFIDEIDRPIVATGGWVHIFTPSPDDKVNGTISLTGLGNVYEGTINYEVVRENGEVILEGFTMAAMGDWAYFEEEIELPAEVKGNIILEVYTESAKDGSKMFVIELPLTVE